jgi:acetyl-CoA carboxylase carboxyl transferase alpha subunit
VAQALLEIVSRHRGDRRLSFEIETGACGCAWSLDVIRPDPGQPSSTLIARWSRSSGKARCRCDEHVSFGCGRSTFVDDHRHRPTKRHAPTNDARSYDETALTRMPPETLDFEEPIAVLLKEIESLEALPTTEPRQPRAASLRKRLQTVRADLYATLTPVAARDGGAAPSRPGLEGFIQRLFPNFVEIHGDRRFADDHAMMTGFADFHDQPVLVVGHVKGTDTKEKIFRNFGYARPEGYRKALRVMRLAEKFRRPIVVFVDTPAAYPGIESEERGVAEAIAVNLRDLMLLDTPIVVCVSGEGGSGGALGIAVGDRVLMQEFAIYSVIPT